MLLREVGWKQWDEGRIVMGQFEFKETSINGVLIIQPKVFGDARGYFMETYQVQDFYNAGITKPFVQDNESFSCKGVLRGLHFQKEHTQIIN